MKAFKLLVYPAMLLSLCGVVSCADSHEPQSEQSNFRLELNLDCEEVGTRATADHSGHKLRYVAILYQGSANNLNPYTFIRRELIDGDTGDEGKQNHLIFDVDPGTTYTIHLFADYVPEDATLKDGSMGSVNFKTYGNYYYDSTTQQGTLYMLPVPQKGLNNNSTPDPAFFNNDNYDCFAHAETFDKTDKNYIINTKLKRMVSKIRFVDNSTNTGSYNVSVKKLGYYRQLDFLNDIAAGITSFDSTNDFSEVTVSSNKNIGSSDKEVIFFYSFASQESFNRDETTFLSFSTTPSSGSKQSFVTQGLTIKRNHITTVSSRFLSEDLGAPADPGGSDPDSPSLDEDGPVLVYLGISTDEWGSISSSWSN